jgi:hypothetical protein
MVNVTYSDGREINIIDYASIAEQMLKNEAYREAAESRLEEVFEGDLCEVVGPFDERNRPACREAEGQIYSINGEIRGYPLLEEYISAGGFGPMCRHTTAVTTEVVTEYVRLKTMEHYWQWRKVDYEEYWGRGFPPGTTQQEAINKLVEEEIKRRKFDYERKTGKKLVVDEAAIRQEITKRMSTPQPYPFQKGPLKSQWHSSGSVEYAGRGFAPNTTPEEAIDKLVDEEMKKRKFEYEMKTGKAMPAGQEVAVRREMTIRVQNNWTKAEYEKQKASGALDDYNPYPDVGKGGQLEWNFDELARHPESIKTKELADNLLEYSERQYKGLLPAVAKQIGDFRSQDHSLDEMIEFLKELQ